MPDDGIGGRRGWPRKRGGNGVRRGGDLSVAELKSGGGIDAEVGLTRSWRLATTDGAAGGGGCGGGIGGCWGASGEGAGIDG